MKTVPLRAFDEAIEDVSRGSPRLQQSQFLSSGVLPVVDQGRSLIAGFTDDQSKKSLASVPVIVFGDHTRAVKYVDFPFAVGADGVKVLRARAGWDVKFLYHYLSYREIPAAGYSRHFKFLKELRVPWLPMGEQRRIAAILDQADAIRTKRRQILAHLDSLTQSIFHDMFGDSIPSVPLGTLVGSYSGGTPSKANKDYWNGDLPWFSAKDLKAPDLWDSQDHIARKVPNETSLKLLPQNTIVLVVRGMILAHTIPVATLRVQATINQDLKALIAKDGIDSDFLAAAIRARSDWLLARVSTAAHGTKKLESAVLASIPIPRVCAAHQRRFAERVALASSARDLQRRATTVEEELFASLQSRAFRGEL